MKDFDADIFDGDREWNVNFLFPRTVLLHSMLVDCGCETRRTPDYHFDGLQRGQTEFSIFQYTIAGEGTLEYEGFLHKMHSGDAMLLHIPHRHRYFLEPGTSFWRHCFLTISGSDAVRLLRDVETRCGPVIHLPRNSEPVQKMVRIIRLGVEKQVKSAFAASSLAYDFAVSLQDFMSAAGPDHDPAERHIMRKVHHYCLQHLAEDIDVSAIAGEAGCSRAYFTRRFKQFYGIPPARFLTELRLSSAIRMLQMEVCSIKEISVRCGFNDESYFCKVFRKYYGMSPERFRHSDLSDGQPMER